jgi:hypothetical protein
MGPAEVGGPIRQSYAKGCIILTFNLGVLPACVLTAT